MSSQSPVDKEGCSSGDHPQTPRPSFSSEFVRFKTYPGQRFDVDLSPQPPPQRPHQGPGPLRQEIRCNERTRGLAQAARTPGGDGGGNDNDVVKTMVYARIAEVFTDEVVLCGYLAQRVSPGLRFRLVALDIDYEVGNTTISLRCASKGSAARLRRDLCLGNAHSTTKVWCFDSLREALQQVMRPHHELQRSYDQHLQQMRRRSEAALAEHYNKITEVEDQLEALRGGGNKHVSLQQFKERQSSAWALEDRLKELRLQQKEFMTYLEDCFARLREVPEARDFEAAATGLRHELAGECNRLAKAFPIYARRSDILATVRQNQVCVVIGETGSGKSTQMAQFFYHAGLASDGLIACTQPRKIAATSLASHVALEMGTSVGQLVGYKVGLQTRRTSRTKILYLTDHVLLNECLRDQTLSDFSVIVIDEAHERSIHTDLLLGMLKDCLRARPELRLVVTSATIDPKMFVRYFGSCPVLTVSGRMFPVEVEWAEPVPGVDSFNNHEVKAVRKAVEVHLGEAAGDVLVFLTSPLETERCCQMFQDKLEGRPADYVALQLHGRLQADEQQRVFEAPPDGKRKVVFATNSAETSVTIPGIKFVIDTGLVKEMKFDPVRKISNLGVRLVAQSSARQRQGRAGRLGPGKCFRLYTEEDFRAMDAASLPEILRVHVGHALLKLMELGVDPLKFDFIAAPSSSAMDEALAGLLALGAVAGGSITPLGKWIAKMPFEPKYGVLVHDAVQVGAGLEAVVVAAASGAGSVFYRAGNTQEKDDADRKKVSFCHEGGDQLTTLNVFRAWYAVPEREKGRWCVSHAINGKTLKAIRETTNEVLDILRRELDVKLQFAFKEGGSADGVVSSLLLRTLRENLSHYLGHPRAGYSAVLKDQRVELHPSCALLPLNSWPQWLVFDQVMQTSRDFAMQVTPVQEEAVLEAVQEGWLQLDVEQARRKRLATVCREVAGRQLFREVVGPRYATLRDLESQLAAAHPQCLVVLEADQERGELRVLSTDHQQPAPALTQAFSTLLSPLKEKFRAEESEQPLGAGIEVLAGVRAVLGAGAAVVTLLMPEEYTTVLVHCGLGHIQDLSEREVRKAFGKYGKVKICTKFFRKSKTSTTWGKVVYEDCEAAAAAVRESFERKQQDRQNRDHQGDGDQPNQPDQQDLPELSAMPNIRLSDVHGDTFKIKIQWCRRRSKGFGYVTFAHVEDYHKALLQCRYQGLTVGTSRALVKEARRTPLCLYVSSLGPLVTEDVLRAAFADRFGLHPLQDVTKVVVVREMREVYPEELHACRRQLLLKIQEFAPRNKFHLEMREPRSARDINFMAYCSFRFPEQGHAACAALNNFTLGGATLSVRPDIHSSLIVHRDVFQQSRTEMEALLARLQESDQIRIKMKPLKSGDVVLDFHTEDAHALGRARARLQEVVKGEVVECDNRAAASARLFSREGRRALEGIMQQTNTIVVADTRLLTVSVHGPQQQRNTAAALIRQYLRDAALEHHRDVELQSGGRPQGLMKSLMLRYGTDLEGLRAAAELGGVQLHLRQHRLRLSGTREAVQRAVDLVDEVAGTLSVEASASPSEEEPECAVCLCPVEGGELYRVECCGHAYCRECVGLQVTNTIASREFPLHCASEGCPGLLVWRDLLNLSSLGLLSVASLVGAAVAAHVQRHHKLFHYCLTPDCPAVYRTSPTGACFVCPECSVRVCTKCHVQYHDGLTCSMFGSMGRDAASLLAWLNEDPAHRKVCPNCSTPIEKVAGCNKMTCSACNKVLCWVCLAMFDTEQKCYGHLSAEHNGFV